MNYLYGLLYDVCELDVDSESSHFVAMEGKNYRSSAQKKIMIIGRAPNGWKKIDTSSKQAFACEAEKQFKNLGRWDWIETVNGAQYLSVQSHMSNLKDRYCVSKKPFWSYSKEICNRINPNACIDEIWQENIVWSNLYKISPVTGYNPNDEVARKQLNICIEILREELKVFEPDYILLLTGFDWFQPFSILFDDVIDFGARNVCRGKNKNDVFVEGIAKYGKAPVIIACRPEWRNRTKYVDAVINSLNSVKSGMP